MRAAASWPLRDGDFMAERLRRVAALNDLERSGQVRPSFLDVTYYPFSMPAQLAVFNFEIGN